MLTRTIALAAALGLSGGTHLKAEVIWPVPDIDIRIMNTISTLQFYGPQPGFHHGVDLAAPPGTLVVAPISGLVETGHYYKRESDYTYEVAITTDDGHRWEFHHIDPNEIPERVEKLASEGGSIEAGAVLGGIYDASQIGIEPHVHVNVIGPDGLYKDPLGLLPGIGDDTAPTLNAAWWARKDGDRLVEVTSGDESAAVLVVDAQDIAPGDLGAQSLQAMSASQNGNSLFSFDLSVLPEPSFLDGVSEVYFLGELELLDGSIVHSEVQETRRFLYAVPLAQIAETVEITLRDASGNSSRQSVRPQ